MSSAALNARGTHFKRGDGGGPEVFTDIPEVLNINGLGGSSPEIDVSDLLSTAREFRLGLRDPGNLTCGINFLPANVIHIALRADADSGVVRNFKIVFSDGTTASFSGLVQQLTANIEGVDGIVGGELTVRITGPVVFT